MAYTGKIAEALNLILYSNTLKEYLLAILVALIVATCFSLLHKDFAQHMRRMGFNRSRTQQNLLLVLSSFSPINRIVIAIYIGSKVLQLPDSVEKALDGIAIIAIVVYIVRIAGVVVDVMLRSKGRGSGNTFQGIRTFVKIVIWCIGLLMIAANLGFNISALATSLGIGGVAVALATQSILSDLFAGLCIYFDRPFEIDDFIEVGGTQGYVEKIGLKTTRIRTLRGEEMIISNTDLTNSRVQNFRRMENRRIEFYVSVSYETPREKLQKVPELVKIAAEAVDGVTFDLTCLVELGEFGLRYEVVYYMDKSGYAEFLQSKNEIILNIIQQFEANAIAFSYPIQHKLFTIPELAGQKA